MKKYLIISGVLLVIISIVVSGIILIPKKPKLTLIDELFPYKEKYNVKDFIDIDYGDNNPTEWHIYLSHDFNNNLGKQELTVVMRNNRKEKEYIEKFIVEIADLTGPIYSINEEAKSVLNNYGGNIVLSDDYLKIQYVPNVRNLDEIIKGVLVFEDKFDGKITIDNSDALNEVYNHYLNNEPFYEEVEIEDLKGNKSLIKIDLVPHLPSFEKVITTGMRKLIVNAFNEDVLKAGFSMQEDYLGISIEFMGQKYYNVGMVPVFGYYRYDLNSLTHSPFCECGLIDAPTFGIFPMKNDPNTNSFIHEVMVVDFNGSFNIKKMQLGYWNPNQISYSYMLPSDKYEIVDITSKLELKDFLEKSISDGLRKINERLKEFNIDLVGKTIKELEDEYRVNPDKFVKFLDYGLE